MFLYFIHVCYILYSKISRKLHQTGRGRVSRESVSELNSFTYCTRIVDATTCIDIMRISKFHKKLPSRDF